MSQASLGACVVPAISHKTVYPPHSPLFGSVQMLLCIYLHRANLFAFIYL